MKPLVKAARLASLAWAMVVASAVSAIVARVLHLTGASSAAVRVAAPAAFVLIGFVVAMIWWRRWTLVRLAQDLERLAGGLDNVIVTAAEAIESPRRPLHPVVAAAVWEAAHDRLPAATRHAPTLVFPLAAAALCMAAAGVSVWSLPVGRRADTLAPDRSASGSAGPNTLGELRVRITPPAYTGRSASEVVNPNSITVLQGSRVRLDVTAADGVQLIDPGEPAVDLTRAGDRWTHTFTPVASRVLLLQPRTSGEPRLLHVRVDPDRPPVVRIQVPARDLVVPDDRSRIPIEIVAEDDLALVNVTLRYTRVAGSGESFTFEEGELPLDTKRVTGSAWHARTTLALERLKLEDGDTLVYRALARDAVPDREPSASETYIVEVGRLAGVSSTGFAVPEERDRQGLSQQMVIIKTERLHTARATLGPDAVLEQARLLAVEQRMVRAEFVFMTGGHVEDEVAEAAAGHDIVEGRLENESQVELLNAIREMSRAEARLNDGDTSQALVFERAALRALQRAFDRRRYLLRTLPERTRIDLERRLTGDRHEARASGRAAVTHRADPTVAAAREMLVHMRAWDRTVAGRAALAARIVAVNPENAELQAVAVKVASAGDMEAYRAAWEDAQRVLVDLLRRRLGTAPGGRVLADPLAGRVGDQLQRKRR